MVASARKTVTCSTCKVAGHTKRNCRIAREQEEAARQAAWEQHCAEVRAKRNEERAALAAELAENGTDALEALLELREEHEKLENENARLEAEVAELTGNVEELEADARDIGDEIKAREEAEKERDLYSSIIDDVHNSILPNTHEPCRLCSKTGYHDPFCAALDLLQAAS